MEAVPAFEAFKQIALLAAEVVAVATLLAVLFRGRRRFGLSPLFATLGVFQYLQVMLAFSLYLEVLPGASISPGSVVLFSGSLFALLLVFLRESPSETKTLVYGLLAANLSMSVISLMVSLHLESPLLRNPYQVPEVLFRLDAKIMVIGTLVLVLDMLLMLTIYPALEKITGSRFLRVAATLCLVLAFDSVAFMTVAFWNEPFLPSALGASVIAKVVAGLLYAAILSAYLRWIEPSPRVETLATPAQVLHLKAPQKDTGHSPAPKDPDLGILPAPYFVEVARQYLALGEQLQSPVAIMSFAIDPQAEVDPTERRDLLRYLLAVLRSQLSLKTVFGRQGHTAISALVPSTGRAEAETSCREMQWALEQALEKVRPTPSTEAFAIVAGAAGSPDDGTSPFGLLECASERMLSSRSSP